MATLVIHGTMTFRGAQHARWWWDSWYEGGFLNSVAQAMTDAAGFHDVWTVNGTPVSQIPELQMKWSLWTGTLGQLSTHQGHFRWAGSDDYNVRSAGAYQLARYLNQVAALAPRERINVVAHSHGCNIVKMASSDPNLAGNVYIDKAVFLACPHFEARGPGVNYYSYEANPNRFGAILNLFSEADSVQVGFADLLPGIPGYRAKDFPPPKAHRQDQDPRVAHLYDNWRIPTEATSTLAHTVMHSAAIGFLVGRWLATKQGFDAILASGGNQLLPILANDVGE